MKKTLQFIKWTILSLLAVIAIGFAYLYFSPIPSYDTQEVKFNVINDSAHIAEGARIASMLCVSCHQSEDGKLGGGRIADANEFGEIYAPNITKVKGGITSQYSDGELAFLIRTGIKRDGQYSPPYMAKLPHISDDDLMSIIAFLRSDHPMVQGSDKTWPDCQPNMLTKFLVRVDFKPFPYPDTVILAPSPQVKVQYGRYIALAKFECFSCHSENFKTNNYLTPEQSKGFMGGGNPFKQGDGSVLYSANLTMHSAGLGKWTESQFITALKSGIRPNAVACRKPMLPYAAMTDEEASAIWAYLKTIPVVDKDVTKLN